MVKKINYAFAYLTLIRIFFDHRKRVLSRFYSTQFQVYVAMELHVLVNSLRILSESLSNICSKNGKYQCLPKYLYLLVKSNVIRIFIFLNHDSNYK